LVVAALALRLIGNRYGLPWLQEPDPESIELAQSLAHGRAGWSTLLSPARYPHLPTLILVPVLSIFPDASPVWLGRTVCGVLGALTVGFVFALARRIGGSTAARLAGTMAAVSFLAVQHGHFVKPHVWLGFFATGALYFCHRLAQSPTRSNHFAVGAFAAMSAGTLLSGLAVYAGVLVSLIQRQGDQGRRTVGGGRRFFDGGVGLVASLAVVGIALGYPHRIHALILIAKGEADFSLLREPHAATAFEYLGLANYRKILATFLQFDPWVGVFATGTIVVVLFRSTPWRRSVLPSYAVALLFFGFFGLFNSYKDRFALMVLPALCVVAGVGMTALAGLFPRRGQRFAVATLGLLALVPALPADLKLISLFVKEDTRELAADWIRENVPTDTKLAAVPYMDFALPLTRKSIASHRSAVKVLGIWESSTLRAFNQGTLSEDAEPRWDVRFPFESRWMIALPQRKSTLKRMEARYGISIFDSWATFNDVTRNAFSLLGDVVYKAEPGVPQFCGTELYHIFHPFLRIWAIDRAGPYVEIVKLKLN